MLRTKPFSHLRQRIDQEPERRRRVADMKRAMLDGQRLAEIRAHRGMTQRGLADALNVSQATQDRA